MHRLAPAVQTYSWGKIGAASAVARLSAAGRASGAPGGAGAPAAPDEGQRPFAELWMGTHPSGPSALAGEPLQDFLQRERGALGVEPYSAETGALPFLLKVLSIAKALSVQAHPDAERARRLHAQQPAAYRDGNHKPELACALTPFEAMCSFRPPGEVARHVSAVPELRSLLGGDEAVAALLKAAAVAEAARGAAAIEERGVAGDAAAAAAAAAVAADAADAAARFSLQLRAAYTALMNQPEAAVRAQVAALESRLRAYSAAAPVAEAPPSSSSSPPFPSSSYTPKPATVADPFATLTADACALRLCADFPGDVGVFTPYLLNVVTLAPGEAIFLAANEPHAYLSGDCVEVMACSDNVVRAGLTPKYKDVASLCEMLTYSAGRPAIMRGEPAGVAGGVREYAAPVREFLLQRVEAAPGGPAVDTPPIASAALLIVVSGTGTASVSAPSAPGGAPSISSEALSEGQVWLQPFGVGLSVSCAAGAVPLVLFRAHVARNY